jgi:hypothetical protein
MAHGRNGNTFVLTDFKDSLSLFKINLTAIDRHLEHLLHESNLQIILKGAEYRSLSRPCLDSANRRISMAIYQEKIKYAIIA